MGTKRGGLTRTQLRRAGAAATGGGGSGVTSIIAGTGIAVSSATGDVTITNTGIPAPPFGPAPPRVASASAAGVSVQVSRSDHTHGLDIVPYQPQTAGTQGSGILQQTYAAPTATPSLYNPAAKAIQFGNISGSGLFQQDTAGFVYDNTVFPRQAIGVGSPFNGIFGPGSLGVGLDISSPGAGQLTALSLQGSLGGISSSGVQIAFMGGLRGGAAGRAEWQCAAIVADDGAVAAYEGHLDFYCNKS